MFGSTPVMILALLFAATSAWAMYFVAFRFAGDLGHSRSSGLMFAFFALPQLVAGALALPAPGILIKGIAVSLLITGVAKLRLAYRIGVRPSSRQAVGAD